MTLRLPRPPNEDPPAERHNWKPGDPLYSRGYIVNELFNFRPIQDRETCGPCVDAASWPEPAFRYNLDVDPFLRVLNDESIR